MKSIFAFLLLGVLSNGSALADGPQPSDVLGEKPLATDQTPIGAGTTSVPSTVSTHPVSLSAAPSSKIEAMKKQIAERQSKLASAKARLDVLQKELARCEKDKITLSKELRDEILGEIVMVTMFIGGAGTMGHAALSDKPEAILEMAVGGFAAAGGAVGTMMGHPAVQKARAEKSQNGQEIAQYQKKIAEFQASIAQQQMFLNLSQEALRRREGK